MEQRDKRKFLEVFTRYTPSETKRALLMRATDASYRYKREPMRVEVELYFPAHEDALTIYEIADECRALYSAESFKIFPHFPASEFKIERFPEIAYEASLCGALTQGFLSGADYHDDGSVIRIGIPFFETGIDFVKSAGTEDILSNILFSRYGVRRRIILEENGGAREQEERLQRQRE